MTNSTLQSADVKQALKALSIYLSTELNVLENELNRTNQFIRESVDGVSMSFKITQEIALKQHQQLALLLENVQEYNSTNQMKFGVKQLSDMSAGLEKAVSNGITALQFEDFTFQSLSSLEKNFLSLYTVNQQLIAIMNENDDEITPQLQKLTQLCESLMKESHSNEKQRSVTQQSLSEGDIELF